MSFIKTIIIALAFTIGSLGANSSDACPNCPHHGKGECGCAKKDSQCDCQKKDGKCDCQKKDGKCDCQKKDGKCDCQKKAPPATPRTR
jgi:hypothetical protein